MTTRGNGMGRANSIPGGLTIAASVSMVITVTMSAVIAYFLNVEKMTWLQAGYWIMGMLFAASFAGGKCAYASIKRKRIAISMMAAALYWGLLLCITALFFGGEFDAVWETAGIIGAGAGTAALISVPNNRNKRKKTGRGYR